MTERALDVQNAEFGYRGGTVIHNISFSCESGHCLALLGNNGAGKTTLLKCLNRILGVRSGIVKICGKDIRRMERNALAQHTAYVAQHTDAVRLTVFDSVLLGRKPYIKLGPQDEDMRITEGAIARMELDDLKLHYIDELSGGELQKVVLARALAQQPKILLLDEPTSSLDLRNQHEVMRTVQKIAKTDNILVIVVIHDLNLALRYCDRFLFIKDGAVFACGGDEIVTEQVISDVYGISVHIDEIGGKKFITVD